MDPEEVFSSTEISAAWAKSDLLANKDFVYQLTSQDRTEIQSALSRCADIPVTQATTLDFRLADFSTYISQKILPQLYAASGVCLLRGLNTEKYTLEELSKIHWGIGLYFGEAQKQYGELLLRVEDQSYQLGEPQAGNSNTSVRVRFHNDSCDIMAMMCVQSAYQGGETQIASAIAIHNQILRKDRTLLETLYQPYYRTYRRISGRSQSNDYEVKPIFTLKEGQFSCDISRSTIERAQRLQEVPKLTQLQMEALDLFETLAESTPLCYEFFLQPGDILYINNHRVLHARKAFKNSATLKKERLLLRLHLKNNYCFRN